MQDRIAVLELRLSEEQEARHKLQQECDVDKKTSEIKLRQAFSKVCAYSPFIWMLYLGLIQLLLDGPIKFEFASCCGD